MNLWSIFVGAIPAACFAFGLGLLLTAPPRYLAATAACGLAGRMVRDLLIGANMGGGWATLLSATSVVVVAAALIRRRSVPPVVMVSGVLPLGAAGATFDMIIGFMRIPNLQGEALGLASVTLVSTTAKAFITYLALSVGISLGMAFLRLISGEESAEP